MWRTKSPFQNSQIVSTTIPAINLYFLLRKMAIHQLKIAHENQLKSSNFQGYTQKLNGISFWASLFSIFIFISVFYIFNLSPSSLLNTTKFWFFISNTIILIIAADFGASKKQAEVYNEYVEKSRGNISFPSFESRYPEKEIVKTSIPPPKVNDLQETQEVVKEVVRENETAVNEMQVVVKDDAKESIAESQGKMVEFPPNVANEADEEAKETEASIGYEPDGEEESEEEVEEEEVVEEQKQEEDEFSKMSNEELNKRVEEFIQRFNRQIRLQGA